MLLIMLLPTSLLEEPCLEEFLLPLNNYFMRNSRKGSTRIHMGTEAPFRHDLYSLFRKSFNFKNILKIFFPIFFKSFIFQSFFLCTLCFSIKKLNKQLKILFLAIHICCNVNICLLKACLLINNILISLCF